jgi:phosphate transport system protein
MSIHYDIQTLRSKLIAMARLTQRTVDYSIKAFQLGRPELCRVVHNSKDEMNAIRCWIANHGRALLAADVKEATDSRFVCAAMRISGALEAAYDAATQIAQRSETHFATGWTPVTPELEDAGQFVNSLLRLCVLSLLKRDARHAQAVLHNSGAGESLDLAVHLTHHNVVRRNSAQVRFEQAIIHCLDGIAGQIREIADSIILWLEETGRGDPANGGAAPKPAYQSARLANAACAIPISATESSCKASGFWGAIALRQVFLLNPPDDCGVPSQGFSEAAPTEEFAQARLMGLQQRVCELLVKNQQLRMALMAERADSHQHQPC